MACARVRGRSPGLQRCSQAGVLAVSARFSPRLLADTPRRADLHLRALGGCGRSNWSGWETQAGCQEDPLFFGGRYWSVSSRLPPTWVAVLWARPSACSLTQGASSRSTSTVIWSILPHARPEQASDRVSLPRLERHVKTQLGTLPQEGGRCPVKGCYSHMLHGAAPI